MRSRPDAIRAVRWVNPAALGAHVTDLAAVLERGPADDGAYSQLTNVGPGKPPRPDTGGGCKLG